MEPYHFYLQAPSANLPALLQLPHLSSLCGCPGIPLPFPSLYLKPLLWAQGGPGSSRSSHFFSADPGFTSRRLPYTPASAPILVPSTCHSPAPAAAERTKTRAAHLCAAFRARAQGEGGRSDLRVAAEPRTPLQLGATAGAGPAPEAVPRGRAVSPGRGRGRQGRGLTEGAGPEAGSS